MQLWNCRDARIYRVDRVGYRCHKCSCSASAWPHDHTRCSAHHTIQLQWHTTSCWLLISGYLQYTYYPRGLRPPRTFTWNFCVGAVCFIYHWIRLLVIFKFLNVKRLTLSSPVMPNSYTSKRSAPYWSNLPFLFFDIQTLWGNTRMSKS